MANVASPTQTKPIRLFASLADDLTELARLTRATPAEIADRLVDKSALSEQLTEARREEMKRLKAVTKSA